VALPGKDNELVPVVVGGLVRDQRNNPVVLLKLEDGEEALPIWIGHAEALAIELQLKGQTFERPLTHDLLKTAIESLGGVVSRVAVTELRDNTFFARIFVQRDNDVIAIDARPSDSIALALKTDAPIFVARDVLKNHKRVIPTEQQPENNPDDELRRYLKDLDPGDF
jgi:bifunctional DNase/RNase